MALIDQVRALDPARVTTIIGALTPVELQPIADGLRAMLASAPSEVQQRITPADAD